MAFDVDAFAAALLELAEKENTDDNPYTAAMMLLSEAAWHAAAANLAEDGFIEWAHTAYKVASADYAFMCMRQKREANENE